MWSAEVINAMLWETFMLWMCLTEVDEMKKGNLKKWCSYCRVPLPENDRDTMKRLKKRMKLLDDEAFYVLGTAYRDGSLGLPKNLNKARELFSKATELGSCRAHYNLGNAYRTGQGVEKDMKKAIHHWRLAAIGGHERARDALGVFEFKNGNMDCAMKHWMISAKSGHEQALKKVTEGYKAGLGTKDDYASTLRAYQSTLDEMKSEQRSKSKNVYNNNPFPKLDM